MSSKGYATPLRIDVVALGAVRSLYLLFCALAVVCLLWLPLPVPLLLLSVVLFLATARHVWSVRGELGGRPAALVWDAAQRWWCSQGGRERELELCGDSYLSTWLCILNFREPVRGKRHAFIVMPEGTGRERYRQLLVRFRISGKSLSIS